VYAVEPSGPTEFVVEEPKEGEMYIIPLPSQSSIQEASLLKLRRFQSPFSGARLEC